ncbi:MAG: PDDEXK nuclease domain-containing protein [Fimbriimonadales bacterium]
MSKTQLPVPADFPNLIKKIKARIQQAQTRAILAANFELVRLYWDIGRLIDQRQRQEGWGAAVIPRLARELRNELPEVKGFSERNIKLMVQFAHEYRDAFAPSPAIGKPAVAQLPALTNGQQLVAQIPWAHNVLLMQRVKEPAARLYLSVVDDQIRHESDAPSLGLILCQDRNHIIAEYALRGVSKPIGISEYELTRALPPGLKSVLPTVEEIEAELTESATVQASLPKAGNKATKTKKPALKKQQK